MSHDDDDDDSEPIESSSRCQASTAVKIRVR